jgi:hypothetical protein
MSKDLLHGQWVTNHGDDAHGVLADGAAQRVNMPDPQNQVALSLGGEFGRRWRGNSRAAGNELRGQSPLRLALIHPAA